MRHKLPSLRDGQMVVSAKRQVFESEDLRQWKGSYSPRDKFSARIMKDSPNTSVPSVHTLNSRDDDYLGGLAVTGAFCRRAVTFLLQNKLPKPTYNAGIYKSQNWLNTGNPARTATEICLLQVKVHKVNLFCSVFQSSHFNLEQLHGVWRCWSRFTAK